MLQMQLKTFCHSQLDDFNKVYNFCEEIRKYFHFQETIITQKFYTMSTIYIPVFSSNVLGVLGLLMISISGASTCGT